MRTASWPCVVHLHIGFSPAAFWNPSPSEIASSVSTCGVQEPQEARGLGTRPHRIQRGQLGSAMVGGDLALADAVAAADLGAVGHGGDGGMRVGRRGTQRGQRHRAAEDQGVAHGGDVRAPRAASGNTSRRRRRRRTARRRPACSPRSTSLRYTPRAASREDDLLVGLVRRVEGTGGEHVDAGDLQPGRQRRGDVGGVLVAGELRGADLRHAPRSARPGRRPRRDARRIRRRRRSFGSSLVRMPSSTTMPRLDLQAGMARPRSMFGRMPTAITTRSAAISRPSASFTPVDAVGRR